MIIEINTKDTHLRINVHSITITIDEFSEEYFRIVERPLYKVTIYRHGKTVDDIKPLLKIGDVKK